MLPVVDSRDRDVERLCGVDVALAVMDDESDRLALVQGEFPHRHAEMRSVHARHLFSRGPAVGPAMALHEVVLDSRVEKLSQSAASCMPAAKEVVCDFDQVAHGEIEFLEPWMLQKANEDFLGDVFGNIQRRRSPDECKDTVVVRFKQAHYEL